MKELEITTPLNSDDYFLFKSIIDQGIDSHLEAFTKSTFEEKNHKGQNRLVMNFGKKDLPILIRRLRESGSKESESWADDIEAV